MPYSKLSELPKSVRGLPVKAQELYLKAFNSSYKNNGDDSIASQVAWSVVKKRFKKVNGSWVGKGLGVALYSFEMNNNSETFITKGNDGEYYLEAVLSDTMVDSDGYQFTEEALKSYADQINNEGIAGFITHGDWKEFIMSNSHLPEVSFVAKARKERKGVLKAVKAIYEKGRLWIKALIDKRYLNHVKKFNKVSIEAVVPSQYRVGNLYTGGHVVGFALDNDAINPRAMARIVE